MPPTPNLPLTPNEADRLRTLRYYDIVESVHEPVFDGFVRLAACLFCLPISLISLVEETEVVYKAGTGMPLPGNLLRQEAVCAAVVQQDEVLVFNDLARRDPARLSAEAYDGMANRHLRFYAGAPLRMPNQRNIGTLCVIDQQPRTFAPTEQQALNYLAEVVAHTIAVRHYCLMDEQLGDIRWQSIQGLVQEEVEDLSTLVRYLLARNGTSVPVAMQVLEPATQRLDGLRHLLNEYRQQRT